MDEAKKQDLMKFTTVAKAIIYNPERMRQLLKMMGTKQGAVTAAKTVVAAIEQKAPVPPEIAPLVAANAYMILVDMAQEVTGIKADFKVVKEVLGTLVSDFAKMGQAKPAQPAPPPQRPAQPAPGPSGLLAQGA